MSADTISLCYCVLTPPRCITLQDVRVRPQGWVEPGWVGAAEAEQWEQAQAARWADPHEQPQVSGPSSHATATLASCTCTCSQDSSLLSFCS